MLALHAMAAGAAMASCCCLGFSPLRRDRRAWLVSILMLGAMVLGPAAGSLGMIVGGLTLITVSPVAVTGRRDDRILGLHRALSSLAMGTLMIAGSMRDSTSSVHSHGVGFGFAGIAVTVVVVVGVIANLVMLVRGTRRSVSPMSLPIIGETLFMIAGVALMAAA